MVASFGVGFYTATGGAVFGSAVGGVCGLAAEGKRTSASKIAGWMRSSMGSIVEQNTGAWKTDANSTAPAFR